MTKQSDWHEVVADRRLQCDWCYTVIREGTHYYVDCVGIFDDDFPMCESCHQKLPDAD